MEENKSGIERLVNGHFHPNRISTYGAGLALASLIAVSFESTEIAAPVIYGAGAICDFIDGKVADKYKMRTKEGASIDPMMDKVKNLAIGFYMIGREYSNNTGLVISNFANFIVDGISQAKRGPLDTQLKELYNGVLHPENCKIDLEEKSLIRANDFGKTKTAIQNIVHATYITSISWNKYIGDFLNIDPDKFEHYVKHGCAALLSVSAVLGAIGVYKRIKTSP